MEEPEKNFQRSQKLDETNQAEVIRNTRESQKGNITDDKTI